MSFTRWQHHAVGVRRGLLHLFQFGVFCAHFCYLNVFAWQSRRTHRLWLLSFQVTHQLTNHRVLVDRQISWWLIYRHHRRHPYSRRGALDIWGAVHIASYSYRCISAIKQHDDNSWFGMMRWSACSSELAIQETFGLSSFVCKMVKK